MTLIPYDVNLYCREFVFERGRFVMPDGALRLPSVNQVIRLGITLLVLLFCLRFMPEQFKQWFRI